jgi:hypothetical protein
MDGIVLIDGLAHTSDLDFINKYLDLEGELGGHFLNPEVSDMMAQIAGKKEIKEDLNSVKDIIMLYIRLAVYKKFQEIYNLYEISFVDNNRLYIVGATGYPIRKNHFKILKTDSHPTIKVGDVIFANKGIIKCSDKLKIPIDIIEIKDYI